MSEAAVNYTAPTDGCTYKFLNKTHQIDVKGEVDVWGYPLDASTAEFTVPKDLGCKQFGNGLYTKLSCVNNAINIAGAWNDDTCTTVHTTQNATTVLAMLTDPVQGVATACTCSHAIMNTANLSFFFIFSFLFIKSFITA